jgi:hypothetical protein
MTYRHRKNVMHDVETRQSKYFISHVISIAGK